MGLPEAIIARFRAVALERLSQAEAAWLSLTRGTREPGLDAELHRLVHTLKGDARVVGFEQVHQLCEKIEDILGFARGRGYQVPDEVDLVATMAFQFVGMLIRKRQAQGLAGVNIEGFVRELEETLAEAQRAPRPSRPVEALDEPSPPSAVETAERLSASTRRRLADVGASVFFEYLLASGPAKHRLRRAWQGLASELGRLETAPLGPLLARHLVGAKDLADSLGKRIDFAMRVGTVGAVAEVAEALDVAVLHAVRNAIDHGVEAPHERQGAGKPAVGLIEVLAQGNEETIELLIRDDGRGVDRAAVRRRAVERGVWSEQQAAGASDEAVLEALFLPGFSTKAQPNQVSGRGVGLDAVRAAMEQAGGTASVRSEAGRGATVALRAPSSRRALSVLCFAPPGEGPLLAVASRWSAEEVGEALAVGVDPLAALGLVRGDPLRASGEGDVALRLVAGEARVVLLAGSRPVSAEAERVFVTSPAHPFEVITVGGEEALLLRPDELLRGDGG